MRGWMRIRGDFVCFHVGAAQNVLLRCPMPRMSMRPETGWRDARKFRKIFSAESAKARRRFFSKLAQQGWCRFGVGFARPALRLAKVTAGAVTAEGQSCLVRPASIYREYSSSGLLHSTPREAWSTWQDQALVTTAIGTIICSSAAGLMQKNAFPSSSVGRFR